MGILLSGVGNFHGLRRWDVDAELVGNRIMGRRQGITPHSYSVSYISCAKAELCTNNIS